MNRSSLTSDVVMDWKHKYLGLLTGIQSNHRRCADVSDLRRDVIDYKKAQFKQWDADTRDKLPDMALEAAGRLMDLDAKDGHVEVRKRHRVCTRVELKLDYIARSGLV